MKTKSKSNGISKSLVNKLKKKFIKIKSSILAIDQLIEQMNPREEHIDYISNSSLKRVKIQTEKKPKVKRRKRKLKE